MSEEVKTTVGTAKKVVSLDTPFAKVSPPVAGVPPPGQATTPPLPVTPTPLEQNAETVQNAEVNNTEPVQPIPPYDGPTSEAKPDDGAPQPAYVPPIDQAPKKEEPPEQGVDEVLESLRKPSKDEGVFKQSESDADLLYNQVLLGKSSEIADDMRKIYKTDEDVKKAVEDESSLLNAVTMAGMVGWNTGASSNSFEGPLSQTGDDGKKVSDHLVLQKTLTAERLQDGSPSRIKHHNLHVSGKQARLLLQARLGGLIRVNLLNSGFWVLLRAPKIDELQDIFTALDIEAKEIGRSIGTHFALITDLYLKKKFIEAMIHYHLIQESNYVNINEPGAFIENLSFHDYDTLIHGVVTLMARNGIRARLVCPKCGKISVEENIDVGSLKMVNETLKNNPKFLEWWGITTNEKGEAITRTTEDLQKYRDEVLGYKQVIKQTIDVGGNKVNIELEMATPSMARYFRVGEFLIKQLNDTITAISNGDAEQADLVKSSLSIHGFQLLAPWIKELRLLKDDGSIEAIITDHNIIIEYLDQTIQQNVDKKLFEELDKFVAATRFNFFGSCSIQCPQCGAKPESGLDNFFALDIQTIFFGLLFRRSGAA